jgi:hypothetical protein
MFSWLFDYMLDKKKSRDKIILDKVLNLLFPPLEIHQEDNKEYYVDFSVDANLLAVDQDIQDGVINEATKNSIKFSIDKLSEIRELLNYYPQFSRTINYYVVGNKALDIVDKIVVKGDDGL